MGLSGAAGDAPLVNGMCCKCITVLQGRSLLRGSGQGMACAR